MHIIVVYLSSKMLYSIGDKMKNLNFVYLLDFYGGMLNDRQREVMTLYYDDDLSLSEIAEITGISRQGAHDLIKRGEAKLTEADAVLGLVNRFEGIKDTVFKLEQLIDNSIKNKNPEITNLIEQLKSQV